MDQAQNQDIFEIDKQQRENFDNYQTEAVLGEGTYGKVYKVQYNQNQQSYALKIFKPVSNLQQMYEKELASLKLVRGKRQFVQLFAQLDQFRQKYKGIVMEFCQGGELLKYIMVNKGLEVQDVRMFLHQIVDILQTLQDNNLAHLDIKSENFFLDQDFNLILGDFGMCEELQQPNQVLNNYRKGSPSYQIIELLRNVPYRAFDADIFAAGVTIFSIYSCLLPFKHFQSYGILFNNPAQFWGLMTKNSPNPAFKDLQSKDFKDFVDLFMKMVHIDPKRRITLQQIKSHPFYVGEDSEDIRPVSTLQRINADQNAYNIEGSSSDKSDLSGNILTRGSHFGFIAEEYEKLETSISNLFEKRNPKVYQEQQGKLNDFTTNVDCETLFKYLLINEEEISSETPILSSKSFKLKCVHKYNEKNDQLAEDIEKIPSQDLKSDDAVIQDILNSMQGFQANNTEKVLKFNINLLVNNKNSKTYVTFTKKEGDSFEFFKQVAHIQDLIKKFQ